MALDVETIGRLRPQNQIHYFSSIGSTMTEAGLLVQANAPHGTVVLADEQTAGIGRLGRSWISERDAGIYCSVLLRLPISPAHLPIASLVLGLATAAAIEASCPFKCDLRWPNDVLINGKKTAGILTHLMENCIVAGIGINVNHRSLPDDLRTPATSLRMESRDMPLAREPLIISLLEQVDTFSQILVTQGSEAIIRAFTSQSSYVIDRRITIEETGETGSTAGLTPHGFLQVRTKDGRLQTVTSGGIRPAR